MKRFIALVSIIICLLLCADASAFLGIGGGKSLRTLNYSASTTLPADLYGTTILTNTGASGTVTLTVPASGIPLNGVLIVSPSASYGIAIIDDTLTHTVAAGARALALQRTSASTMVLPVEVLGMTLTPPTTGLITGFSFEDIVGTTAEDVSTNNNDGTLRNGTVAVTTHASCVKGDCVEFDGINDDILMSQGWDTLLASSGTVPVSFSYWVYFDVSTEQTILMDTNDVLHSTLSSSAYLRAYRHPTTTQHASALSTGQWYHVVITHSNVTANAADSVNIYINGALVMAQTNTNSSETFSASTDLYLGSSSYYGSSAFLNGKLDEVYIYNRVLTTNEITVLYYDGIVN